MAQSLRVVYGLSALYIVLSCAIIAFNRHLLQPQRFPYAVALVWTHCAFCSIMSGLLFFFTPELFPSLTDPARRVTLDRNLFLKSALPVALCFSGQLALSNTALKYSSVSFLQMMKECNIAVVYVLSLAVALEKFGWQTAGLLTVIFFATTATVAGEVHFSLMGFMVQASSQLFDCVKIVMQAVLLTAAGKKLDVLTYVMIVMPLCLLTLSSVLSVLVYFSPTPTHYMPPASLIITWAPSLALNAMLAFSLNVAIALLVKHSDAVIFVLAGILKDVFIVAVASVALEEHVSALQFVAFTVQVITICIYTAAKTYPDKFEAGILPGLSWVAFGTEVPDTEKAQIAVGKGYGTAKA